MALRFSVDPDTAPAGKLLQIESDAPTNAEAIAEVEAWCAANGFRRFQEYHLPVLRRQDGTVVRVSRCYRMYPQEAAQYVA